MGKYYITTTLPYVNAEPHVGFALEIIRADVLARLHRELGDDVFFNTGTDEHGQKIYQKAMEEGLETQVYCDKYAEKFRRLKDFLELSYDNFIRTTDEFHIRAAGEFWKRCEENGDIYKKAYQTKYCVGCELEKTDSELEGGRCPIHPNKDLEIIEEENYFFKFSKYQERLLALYAGDKNFVAPSFRQKEIENFVRGGLQDFSISRLKAKMPWGIEVPGDSSQVMYVWFDALINYISALGWPEDSEKFSAFWPGSQICGKDNLRQQAAMWQAMLMSAGLPRSKQILVNGFIMADGQKMSKSVGNVIDPIEYVQKYGSEALRYFLLAKLSTFEDGDFTRSRFEEVYQADLANGIGNLCARVAAMAEKISLEIPIVKLKMRAVVVKLTEEFRFDEAMAEIWGLIKAADTRINEKQLWKLDGEEKKHELETIVGICRQIAVDLKPFLPVTARKIETQFGGEKVTRGEHLFLRLE